MTLPEKAVNYPVKFSRRVECNMTLPERTVKNPVKFSRGMKSSDAERTANDTCGDAH
jgi:hypothetical protein